MEVIGRPSMNGMTNHGRPSSVTPASSTVATFGWSMTARACRSFWNRIITMRDAGSRRKTFSATRRRTGSSCDASHTVPNPPSPSVVTSV